MNAVTVYAGDRLGDYSFGTDHPFGPLRQDAFLRRFHELGLDRHCRVLPPQKANNQDKGYAQDR